MGTRKTKNSKSKTQNPKSEIRNPNTDTQNPRGEGRKPEAEWGGLDGGQLDGRRVLVTGGTGFIGSHLVRRLVREGAEVTLLIPDTDCERIQDVLGDVTLYEVDICTDGAVRETLRQVSPEIVFHLAAVGVTDPFLEPDVALRVNLDGTIHVVRAAAEVGARRIIHTGTSYEYGDLAPSGKLDPISPYAASKAAAWAFCRMYHRTMGWPIVCLRLFQVYGPGQRGTLIPSAIEAGLAGKNIATTPGEQVRDWTYIDDVIEAYLHAATAEGIDGETFDIGTGVGTSVREVVELVFEHMDSAGRPDIGALLYRPGEVWRLVANPEPAANRLGWRAEVPLVEGLMRTLSEYESGRVVPPLRTSSAPAPAESAERDALRREILAKVEAFYVLAHARREWVPGKTRVHYAGRVFDARELREMTDAVLEFWLTEGRYAEEFERLLGTYLGIREVIPVNSGSSANLVAITTLRSPQLRSRPLQLGDEVITTAVTFPTTLAPIIQNGLVPVLVDSHVGHYNIDTEQLDLALSERTRAVFVAHTLGNPVEMDRLMAFAREHDLYVIEDNCDALGSTFDRKMTGTFGDLGTSSFYPAHHITLGEGGAVYTDSPSLAKIARTVRDWGRDCWCGYRNPPNGVCGKRFEWEVPGMEGVTYDHRYLFTEIGYNLKITDPQAAVGVAQLEKLPAFVEARKRNFRRLYEGIAPLEEFFILPSWSQKADPSWFAFPLTVRPEAPFTREALQRYLEEHMIETRLLFAGNILKQPGYQNIPRRVIGELPVADLVIRRAFFVGVYPGLGPEQIDYMIDAFHSFVRTQGLRAG
jgi:CDP-6-deoxy-D-xylo-4-hexulose-3-dehydrase